MRAQKLLKVKEGSIELFVPKVEKITSKNEVFYNPAQVVNRDISVLLASCMLNKNKAEQVPLMSLSRHAAVLDLLSASGVRAIRFAKECGLENVYANDANPAAVRLIRKNAKQNRVKLKIFNLRAHEFLATRYKLKDKKFDYLDVDPFGTPVPFLDAAVKALNPKGGILAVTATDTAALCGSAPKACLRKYGAVPLRNELMHEIGIRILLGKIIEVGAQYDIALTPIFVHSTLHYVRVYLKAEKGAEVADKILENIGKYQAAGPMWLGKLWDEKITQDLGYLAFKDEFVSSISADTRHLLFKIVRESKIPIFGFYDLSTFGLNQVPKINDVIAGLHAKGFLAARTHFCPTGIRTNADSKEFKKLI